ncbi:S-methyl-5-thioribose-1-phosphate isomerase [Roseofilum casamattae]|uniref:Methylthioribose-1-phosphate isomerase n=1 Tax=Roseofilum casamattae BLCC-M143 TaxID=3022442 RepID=A0ABT7BWD8_9CYAN|nr:S-methyl-5-thioribose-1-phosphate isomerase [Roseofilum casamattae]MDJ1183491.1 S-methyl-5-thioribose-1-phosphate isomerase [Roseofilum casamattae BLCC-M143]
MTSPVFPIRWDEDNRCVILIDQTQLPTQYTTVAIATAEDMAVAIKTMIVRGAPAIGVSAAYGMALGAREIQTSDRQLFLTQLDEVAQMLKQTRPTAVNLFWAISRMLDVAQGAEGTPEEMAGHLLEEAKSIHAEDLLTCQAIGREGLNALPGSPERLKLLTHCNAGALATAGYGTALSVVRAAWDAGRLQRLYADETRPRLQGAKLTAWECVQEGIPVTVISDNMAAHCMQQGLIDAVVVGADRISANGDTANKIGTYGVAIAARTHNIPFYVAAPLSTVDFKLSHGQEIPIEERDIKEVYQVGETRITPEGADYYNPAFDVTPAEFITAIITEKGAVAPQELRQFS